MGIWRLRSRAGGQRRDVGGERRHYGGTVGSRVRSRGFQRVLARREASDARNPPEAPAQARGRRRRRVARRGGRRPTVNGGER
jgi:hypothetical protein